MAEDAEVPGAEQPVVEEATEGEVQPPPSSLLWKELLKTWVFYFIVFALLLGGSWVLSFLYTKY